MESQKNDFGWRIGNRLFAHPTFPFGVGNKRSGKPAWWPQIKFEGKRYNQSQTHSYGLLSHDSNRIDGGNHLNKSFQWIEKRLSLIMDSLFDILRYQRRRQPAQVINGTLGVGSCRKDSLIIFFEDRKPILDIGRMVFTGFWRNP